MQLANFQKLRNIYSNEKYLSVADMLGPFFYPKRTATESTETRTIISANS